MSIFTSAEIILLSMLIMAFLQLEPGIFALFSHYASGKFPRKKRAMLKTFFMLGAETISACLLICALLFSNLFFFYSNNPETDFIAWLLIGIFLALAVASILYYYRPGKKSGSQLFIPRRAAETLSSYAKTANTRSDAFILGALTLVLEAPFILPIYLASAISIVKLSLAWEPTLFLALLLALSPLIPLIFIRYRFHLGYTLADTIRSRIYKKRFVRIILCFSYTALALLFITNYFF